MKKQRVFLTGVGGTMGGAALQEFVKPENAALFELVVLDLPTEANQKKLLPYHEKFNLEIIWGDLRDYEKVLQAVSGADFVLHAAAYIPPAADHHPELAMSINIGAAENIVRAIKAQADPDSIKLVNIGTVAETGDRLPPIHVGRTGDPIMPSVFDSYAVSKVAAERIVAESGLRYWVSLRQTFILSLANQPSPIMFHSPLNTCMEACTVENSGLVLLNVCKKDLPDSFWRRFYNIGDGPASRFTYEAFLKRSSEISGFDYQKVYKKEWFATQNFHCQYYEDSWVLNTYLEHQQSGVEDYFMALKAHTPWFQKGLMKLLPSRLLQERIFKPLASKQKDSTLYWIEQNNHLRTAAFFGSKEAHAAIGSWDGPPAQPDWYHYKRLDHGYDEQKSTDELGLSDMQQAAAFRGGECLSESMQKGDLFTPLLWRCAFRHQFEASPNLILKGGHWCTDCAPPAWNYDEEAKNNPFIAQAWYAHHSQDEINYYPPECVNDLREDS